MAFYRNKIRGEWEEGGFTDLKQAKAASRYAAAASGEIVSLWSESANRIIYRAKPPKRAKKSNPRRANPDIFKAIGKKVIGIVQQGGKIVGIKVR